MARRQKPNPEEGPLNKVATAKVLSRVLKPATADRYLSHARREQLSLAIGAIETAISGISAIEMRLIETKALCEEALSGEAKSRYLLIAERVAAMRKEIDAIAAAADWSGVNLIAGEGAPYDVTFDNDQRKSHVLCLTDFTCAGLALTELPAWSVESGDLLAFHKSLDAALFKLRRAAETYCKDAAFLAAYAGLRAA